MALLRIPSTSILYHVYDFIRECDSAKQRVWPSMARELACFARVIPRLRRSLRAPPWQTLLCADACESGYAVVERPLTRSHAASVIRHDERWRFRHEHARAVPARLRALGLEDVSD
eukprot:13450251-Alexandrium_andersonii.AAC.1